MTVNHITMWHVFVASFALTAAVGDLRWRKIPRTFATTGLIAGLLFHGIFGGIAAFLSALAASVIGLAIGLAFFQLGAIGGGDVKLIVALAGMLGLNPWLHAMEIAVLTAGAIALLQAIRRGMLRQTLRNIWETLRWIASAGVRAHPEIHVNNSAMLRAPFGVAAAVGVLFAIVKP